MPEHEELEMIVNQLMEDLYDRVGTGGRDEEIDQPVEGDYYGDDQ